MAVPEATRFELDLGGRAIRGERTGDGAPIVACHGLTATRRYVFHGSAHLARKGFAAIAYDARGHGESDPAESYDYPGLVEDLAAVVERVAEGPAVVAGHSMGAHTAVALAIERPDLVAGLALVGPAYAGLPPSDDELAAWERLASGLEEGGVEGFIDAYDRNLDPQWRETLLRIARERLGAHRHPAAVARALREVPRSVPFETLDELRAIDLPALVVGSRDDADPGHPLAVAERWAAALPAGRLEVEDEGRSPLAWQGGRLSRAVAEFAGRDAVRRRLDIGG